MKNLVYSFASIIVLFSVLNHNVQAQQGRGVGGGGGRYNMDAKEMAERQTNMMKDNLTLTEGQLPKMEKINMKYAEKMETARDNSSGDRTSMRSTMMSILEDKDVELKTVLTTDQFNQLLEVRKKARAQGQGRGRGL